MQRNLQLQKSKLPLKQFPVSDNSKLILNKILEPVVLGKEYYFEDDMQLHGKIWTGLKFHFWGGIFSDIYLAQTFQIDQNAYNTVFFGEMRKTLITLKDDDDNILLDGQPCASLLANYGSVLNIKQNKYYRRFFLQNVSLKASYIQFTEAPITPLPFIVPFSVFYR